MVGVLSGFRTWRRIRFTPTIGPVSTPVIASASVPEPVSNASSVSASPENSFTWSRTLPRVVSAKARAS